MKAPQILKALGTQNVHLPARNEIMVAQLHVGKNSETPSQSNSFAHMRNEIAVGTASRWEKLRNPSMRLRSNSFAHTRKDDVPTPHRESGTSGKLDQSGLANARQCCCNYPNLAPYNLPPAPSQPWQWVWCHPCTVVDHLCPLSVRIHMTPPH